MHFVSDIIWPDHLMVKKIFNFLSLKSLKPEETTNVSFACCAMDKIKAHRKSRSSIRLSSGHSKQIHLIKE